MADKKRIECLDSLRGVAALAVIGSHMNLDYFNRGATMPFKNTPLHIFYDGEAAVVFFFVLSGFVLSNKYFNEGMDGLKNMSYRSFIISRVFRIYPLFWVALALTAFCATHFSHSYVNIPARSWTSGWYYYNFNWVNFLKQATLIYVDPILGPWIGPVINHQSYLPQYWTLDLELILSVLVPVFMLIAIGRPAWLIFFTAVLVVMFNMYAYLIHFVLGVLMALYLPRINTYIQYKSTGYKVVVFAAGVFLYCWRYTLAAHFNRFSVLQKLLFSETSILLFVGVGACLIMVSVLNSARLKALLSISPIRLIGKVSYGIYLCHTIMLVFFTPMLIYWLNGLGLTSTIPVLIIAYVSTVTGSVIIAFILHHLVELKFIALGKKVNTYLSTGWRGTCGQAHSGV